MTSQELKTKREALGLSQKELASLIGVGKNTIYNYESGGKIPKSKIPILESVLNPNNDIAHEVVNEKVSGEKLHFEDVLSKRILEEFRPKLEIFYNFHKGHEKTLNEQTIYISQLLDRAEEIIEKLEGMEKMLSRVDHSVSNK